MKGLIHKKIWWFIVVLLGIVVLAIFIAKWLRTDEPLNKTAQKFIQPDLIYRANLHQHAYFYLLGMDAKDELDPNAIGRYRYHREWANYIQEQGADTSTNIDQSLNQQLRHESFSETELELFKDLQTHLNQSSTEFKNFVAEHQVVLQRLINRERIPLKRLSDFIQQETYAALVMPAQASYPDYRYLRFLQLLSLVQIELNSTQKLERYEQQFNRILRFTDNRLSLVEKMLMQNWLSQLVDLMRDEQLMVNKKIYLDTLNAEQLGLKASLQNELMASYLMTQYLPYSKEIDREHFKWLYLPQKTFNGIAQQYEVYWMLSDTPYAQLLDQFSAIRHETESRWRLKNAIGHVLSQVGHPNFEKYLLMNHVLNNKIIAFNALNAGQIDIAGLNQNPEGRRYFQKAGKLCVEVPFPKYKLSELNLKIDNCVRI